MTDIGQHGLFTRQQATAGGATRAMLRSRVHSGILDQVGTRTFTSPLVPRSALYDLRALMLDIGDPVWACGPTAAALERFDGFVLRAPFYLVVLRDRNVRRLGHVVRTTTSLPLIDRGLVQGIAVTSPSRTVNPLASALARSRRRSVASQASAATDFRAIVHNTGPPVAACRRAVSVPLSPRVGSSRTTLKGTSISQTMQAVPRGHFSKTSSVVVNFTAAGRPPRPRRTVSASAVFPAREEEPATTTVVTRSV